MSVKEFLYWLEGFEYRFSDRGHPDKHEWDEIKTKLESVSKGYFGHPAFDVSTTSAFFNPDVNLREIPSPFSNAGVLGVQNQLDSADLAPVPTQIEVGTNNF